MEVFLGLETIKHMGGSVALVGRLQGCGLRNGRVSIHSLGSPRGAQPRAERPHGAHADAGWGRLRGYSVVYNPGLVVHEG